MIREQTKELLVAMVVLVCAVTIRVAIPFGIALRGEPRFPNPRSFPELLATLFVFLSVLLLIDIYRKRRRPTEEGAEPPQGRFGITLVVCGVIVAYSLTIRTFGFVVSSVVYLSITMWILDARKWQYYAALLGTIAGTLLLFTRVMGVTLP